MKMATQHAWEVVIPPPTHASAYADTRETQRLRVPGGWLYQVRHWVHIQRRDEYGWSVTATTMVFVPDAPAERMP